MVGPRIPVKPGISSSKVIGVPQNWDPIWFKRFIGQHLQQLDTRNSVAGPNIQITSTTPTGLTPQPATISAGGFVFTPTTPGLVPASGGGTANFLRADGTFAPVAGGVTGLANPTAIVGLTAVNGSAATAMRSDAAPPIDQTIAPTWTKIHTFVKPPVVPNYTVAFLPSIHIQGAKALVTDANAPVFGNVVAGGGGSIVPVYDDGTNWRVG